MTDELTYTKKLEEFKADLRALLTKYNCELHLNEIQVRGSYQQSILFECMDWDDYFEYDAGSWVSKDTV